jgi:hypothetical protein
MHAFAGAITDPDTRAAFLTLPACREVQGAADRDEWPAYACGAPAVYDAGKEKRVERRRTTS